jgi:hypothetical protein
VGARVDESNGEVTTTRTRPGRYYGRGRRPHQRLVDCRGGFAPAPGPRWRCPCMARVRARVGVVGSRPLRALLGDRHRHREPVRKRPPSRVHRRCQSASLTAALQPEPRPSTRWHEDLDLPRLRQGVPTGISVDRRRWAGRLDSNHVTNGRDSPPYRSSRTLMTSPRPTNNWSGRCRSELARGRWLGTWSNPGGNQEQAR